MKLTWVVLASACVACTQEPRFAAESRLVERAAATPPAAPTVLIELFTSEGCSSCPPAEAALREIVRAPPAGVRVIALELHVDYWNGLGHVDPFSSALFTERQQAYAQQLRGRGLYTPQAVVDGQREFVGSRAGELAESVAEAARRPHAIVTFAEGGLHVGALPEHVHDARVMLAEVNTNAATKVLHGENAGLTLRHNWVATQLRVLGKVDAAGGTFPLPSAVAAQARGRVAFVVAAGSVVGSATWPE